MKDIIQNLIDGLKGLMQLILTFVAVVIFFKLAAAGYDPDSIFKVVVGIIIFWFGYTAVKNFTFTGSGKNGTPPKVDNGQSASTDEDDLSVVEEDEPVSAYESFDEAAFDAALERDVEPMYSVKNPATKFYLAWDRGTKRFDPEDPVWGAYIEKLVNLYFSSIWGLGDEGGALLTKNAVQYAIDHLNDDKGCTTCTSNLACKWTTLQQKADYMGKTSYAYALKWVETVENYLG